MLLSVWSVLARALRDDAHILIAAHTGRSGCGSRACVSARDFDPDHRAHPQTAQNGFLILVNTDRKA
jgi:hypothetical protein